MAYNNIILEKEGGIAKIILNRPHVLNALNEELLSELVTALEDIEKDNSVNVVILTGKGQAFSAGRDLNPGGFEQASNSSGKWLLLHWRP